jgi:hypothetical protein
LPPGFDSPSSPWDLLADRGATGPTGPTGAGVPVGGTDGQILTKTSSTDYATAWENIPDRLENNFLLMGA